MPDTPLDALWKPPAALRIYRERRLTDVEMAELARSGRPFFVTSAEIEALSDVEHTWLHLQFVNGDTGLIRLTARHAQTIAERRALVEALQRGLGDGSRVGPCRLGKRRTRRGPAVLDLEPAEVAEPAE